MAPGKVTLARVLAQLAERTVKPPNKPKSPELVLTRALEAAT